MAMISNGKDAMDFYEVCKYEAENDMLDEGEPSWEGNTVYGLVFKIWVREEDEVFCDWKPSALLEDDPTRGCDFPAVYRVESGFGGERLRMHSCYLHWVNMDTHRDMAELRTKWYTHGGIIDLMPQVVQA